MSNNVLPDPLNVNVVSPDPLPVSDFFLEVAKLNEPGHTGVAVLTRINSTVAGSFEDFGTLGGASNIFKIMTAQNWEIISDDSNDSEFGTGAQTVDVISLDENHVLQVTNVVMNGTTAVPIPGTHLRPRQAIVARVGVNPLDANIGNIIVRVAGTTDIPNVRNYIVADQSLSKDATFTVEAGKSAFILQTDVFPPKNADGIIRNVFKQFGTDTPAVTGLDLQFYQNSINFPVRSPFLLPEKTDAINRILTSSSGFEIQGIFSFVVVDNDKIGF